MMSSSDEKDSNTKQKSLPALDLSALNSIYSTPSSSSASRSSSPMAMSAPDYIAYNQRGRDWYARLSFNTGIFWIGGFVSGGSYGFVEGWRNAASPNYKIRFNSVLNGVSRRGSVLGSSLGILAFLHTGGVVLSDTLELEQITGFEAVTPIFAGALTGGVFKAAKGPRAAALASVIGAAASTVYWYGTNFVSDIVLGRGGRY